MTGIQVDLTGSGSLSRTALAINVNDANSKVIIAKNSSNTKYVFTVLGDGRTVIHSANNNNNVFSIKNTEDQDIFKIYGNGKLEIRSSNDNSKVVTLKNSADQEIYNVYGNGNVWAKEVKVALQNPYPDYVFEESYKMMSINDLEKFIKTNKHLPNIPSAGEIETNGLDLGETQRLQMEKIEELTLYIIELKKEIEALKENNNLK